MVQTVSILDRLARREREARVRPTEDDNVHVSDVVGESAPAGVEVYEWRSWADDPRYVLLERLGVGDELGMNQDDAVRRAVIEARMADAGVTADLLGLVGLALWLMEGASVVSVQPRSRV